MAIKDRLKYKFVNGEMGMYKIDEPLWPDNG